jgi:hypothetical protein
MVTETFEELGQVPEVVYVTEYVPGFEADISIVPVEAFNESPAVEPNVPPAKPVIVGVGSDAFVQYDTAL